MLLVLAVRLLDAIYKLCRVRPDDLSSEDGGSPTAVKGVADLKVDNSSQDASKRGG